MNFRHNLSLLATVNKGIRIDNERGTAIAWFYMSQRGVPTQVILRVLADPAKRRLGAPKSFPLGGKTRRNIFRLSSVSPEK